VADRQLLIIMSSTNVAPCMCKHFGGSSGCTTTASPPSQALHCTAATLRPQCTHTARHPPVLRWKTSCRCLLTYCLTGAQTGQLGLLHFWW
jgi:hypothetical protein